MKYLLIPALWLMSCPLRAETVGNVEFQFPPSQHEWKLLVGQDFFFGCCKDEEFDEEEFDEPDLYTEEAVEKPDLNEERIKLFTHREGDALELFFAVQMPLDPDNEEDDEIDTVETVQLQLNECINSFLQNHKFIVNQVIDEKNGGFVEWEFNDGTYDIMHGFSRVRIKKTEQGLAQSFTVLSYLTTGCKSEQNRMVWTDVLNQAKFLD